ncbi:hypothetical protein VI26_09645 [Chromobacterium sp. LK1]|nr:hypothetical protein VI26_09645 [Chromobacterium sp. LK1]
MSIQRRLGPTGRTKNGIIQTYSRDSPKLSGNALHQWHISLWSSPWTRSLSNANLATAAQNSVNAMSQLTNRQTLCTANVIGTATWCVEQHHPQPVHKVSGVQIASQWSTVALDLNILTAHRGSNEITDREMFIKRQIRADERETTGDCHLKPRPLRCGHRAE